MWRGGLWWAVVVVGPGPPSEPGGQGGEYSPGAQNPERVVLGLVLQEHLPLGPLESLCPWLPARLPSCRRRGSGHQR